MTGTKGIVLGLTALAESRYTAELTDRAQRLRPAGEHFMNIALVRNIEQYLILRGIKDPVQGNAELNNSQIGCQVPTRH